MSWYWCLKHLEVEQGDGCPNNARLGPYETREQAEGAPARTRARTEQEDARDAADDDWGNDRA